MAGCLSAAPSGICYRATLQHPGTFCSGRRFNLSASHYTPACFLQVNASGHAKPDARCRFSDHRPSGGLHAHSLGSAFPAGLVRQRMFQLSSSKSQAGAQVAVDGWKKPLQSSGDVAVNPHLSMGELETDIKPPQAWQGQAAAHNGRQNFKFEDGEETKMLAAVDMGTNSFHMVVVKADSHGRFQIQDVEKEDVRLGSGSAGFSMITPEAQERALAAIKRLKKIAGTRKAVMRVVATSAVREARNRRAFVRHIQEAAGVDVEVLTGREEACLIYMGILQALPVYEKTVLTVDIGGGSTEFVLGRAGKPLFATSLKLGHIRLTERFVGPDGVQRLQLDEMRRFIRVVLADSGVLEVIRNTEFEVAIGSSGTIETIHEMIHLSKAASPASVPAAATPGAAPSIARNSMKEKALGFKDAEFTLEELSAMVKKICKAKTVESRMKISGLPEKRADVIVGGAVLLEEIFMATGIKKMQVSPFALREGVIVETLMHACVNFQPTPNLRRTSVLTLAQRFNIDSRMDSALHSAVLAKQIMAGLLTCKVGVRDCMSEAVTKLEANDCELLEAATILHYVGMFISHSGYHKHSHYLIKNNEHLLGYSPMEIEIIALLAKYHRKKVPSSKDEDFAKLPDEIQRKIRALAAVIRVAVALDRCDSGAVRSVTVLQDYDTCVLAVTPATDPATGAFRDVSLEIWAANAELPYFEKIFKRFPSIVVADESDAETMGVEPSSSLSS